MSLHLVAFDATGVLCEPYLGTTTTTTATATAIYESG
jgi:hypothetical protein